MEEKISKILLETKAVSLQPSNPFTFVSGLKSPIYCDNRLILSYPDMRKQVISSFVQILKGTEFDVVAGTATAGIPWAAWIAEELNKPMIYVRGKSKGYGKKNKIEGVLNQGQRVVVVEDLVSSGGSSIDAVESVRQAGGRVDLCVAIFTYGQQKSVDKFRDANCELKTLTNLNVLIDVAAADGFLREGDKHLLLKWQKDPERWGS